MRKLSEATDGEPTVVDLIRRGRCDLVINTPEGRNARSDGYAIREAALARRVPCITTLSGAAAAVHAIAAARAEQAMSLQERIDAGLASPSRHRVTGSERVGPYTLLRLERGELEPGRAGTVLHARGPGTAAAAAVLALPRAARRARLPRRPDRPRDGGALPAGGPRRDRGARAARARVRLDVERALLVGGGIGIAPLPYLAEQLGGSPPAVLGFRSSEHAEAAALLPGAEVVVDPCSSPN